MRATPTAICLCLLQCFCRMFEDIPTFWDAWDIEVTHLEKAWDAGNPAPAPPAASGKAASASTGRQLQGSCPAGARQLPGPIPGAAVQILERGPLRAMLKVRVSVHCVCMNHNG